MSSQAQINRLAEILIQHSLRVGRNDNVLLTGPTDAEPLILACYANCLQTGAYPWVRLTPVAMERTYFSRADSRQIEFISPFDRSALELADCLLFIRTESNIELLSGLDPAPIIQRRQLVGRTFELIEKKRWCASFFPSQALARQAGLPLEEFTEEYYRATNCDWEEVGVRDSALATRLDEAKEIRLIGDQTDLVFSIEGRKAVVCNGQHNLPDGEVATAPVEDSVEGVIRFDVPVYFETLAIAGVTLHFQEGEVVAIDADRGQDILESLINSDNGSRRLGEFGIGTNFGMDRPLGHVAFDEKIGGTIHLALGFSPAGTGGRNQSNIHFDLIKDLRSNGQILVDGVPVSFPKKK
jgi:aminopeptidase